MNRTERIAKMCLLFILISVLHLNAQNPILSGYADPHMKIWNGKMFIAVDKDKDPALKKFVMPYWSIYSTTDLVNWTLETNIDPKDTYMGEGSVTCWAPDITTKDGNYYFYFSNGGKETGVLRADRAEGPYIDVLQKPMIADDFSVNHEYDPTIFVDDDRQQYIIFGRNGFDGKNLIHYQIAKLSDDMLSLGEKPHDLLTEYKYGFGGEKRARDHQYFHKYKDNYYLSCGGDYRTSKNIYGPYSNPRKLNQIDGHSSFCEFNGQWYHMYEYICEPFGVRQYRQVSLTYLHFKDNGDMVDDEAFIQGFEGNKPGSFFIGMEDVPKGKYYANGVGRYDAQWPLIESEWFFKREGALEKKESPNGGFEIQNIQDGDYLNFPNVRNIAPKATITFKVASIHKKGGTIEVHEGSSKGALLGICKVKNTGSIATYENVTCNLKNMTQTTDLYFVFKGGKGELMRLDNFSFKKQLSQSK